MRRIFALFAAALAAVGCESCCNPTPPNGGPCSEYGGRTCEQDADCNDHEKCRSVEKSGGGAAMCCKKVVRTCQTEADCCPGQTCPTAGECYDKCEECTDDAACGGSGERFCLDFNDGFCGAKRCMYKRCADYANSRCPDGQFCFNGLCLAEPPCNGSCAPGTVCMTQTNICQYQGGACQLTCQAGFIAVFEDSSNIWDSCDRRTVICKCVELPPLASNDLGRHSATTELGGKAYVSLYDGQFGDLVVATIGAAGEVEKMDWVDGVPASGTVVAGPSGPRKGISDPGQDVGKHTDIAAASGSLHVSYYDVSNGDLKYVERNAAGTWVNMHSVDGTGGQDTGLYTSLATDPSGNPAIAYFERAGATGSTCTGAPSGTPVQYLTALKLARGKVPHPTTGTDWTIEVLDCGARPIPPCTSCAATQACVESGATGACEDKATGCSPGCGSSEECVVGAPNPTCKKKYTPLDIAGVPSGVGLFPSLAFNGQVPVVAYYDSIGGNLKMVVRGATKVVVAVDGVSGVSDTGDVGQFPSLLVDGGKYLVAYHDFTRRHLRIYSHDTGTAPTPIAEGDQRAPPPALIIDTGVTPATSDGPTWVGADATLVELGADLYAAYQNSTNVDLKLSFRPASGAWALKNEWKVGGTGFWADAAVVNGKLFISHALIHTKLVKGQAVLDNRLKVEVFQP